MAVMMVVAMGTNRSVVAESVLGGEWSKKAVYSSLSLCFHRFRAVYSSLSLCFHRFRAVYFLALHAGKRLELMQFGIIYGTLIPGGLIEDFGCNSEIGELKLGFRGFNHD
ncbi:hypothetical protein OIU76_025454 [Salix suchowensis]|uniref:Uncharacterized protein n=1 Tax=Salix suchowensis TaxID=1278906 RepID=A0ABQ9AE22_9ROSI|nr:hypothetical protein OIU78_025051 [Salix suchowensis]KAJ6333048.1 hypothetical protein OIU77_008996 [Salix suchowensis]KAJ6376321.1 hypothetical protein OIU76_025454 [Salix suchowensis]